MTKKQKIMLVRILIAALLLVGLNFVPAEGWLRFVLYLIPYLVIGYDILLKAFKGIRNGQVFDECFLMAVATIGAIALALYERSGDYTEAIAVMLFYQIGEWFQSYAVGKSRRNISELMDIRPDYANMERDGKLEKVDPYDVEIGSTIVVQPGEKVPLDGIIVEGNSTLNTSALTGESLPKDAKAGDEIISGCINMTGVLKIRTTKEFGESTVSNSGSGGECKFPEIPFGRFYLQICPGLYACGLLCGTGTCVPAAACPDAFHGASGGLGNLDLPGAYLPRHQLSVCPCDQYST